MKRNEEFRKLLEDARNAPEKKPGESGPKPAAANPGGAKKKSLGSKKFQQLMERKAREKEQGDEGQYRDRADERRKDKNEEPESEVAAAVSVDIEMSKYLGGDLEHTHLVKGLDFALLNKVRGELEQKSSAGGSSASTSAGTGGGRQAMLKTTKFSSGGLKRAGSSAASVGPAGTHIARPLDGSRGGSSSGVATVATHTHMGKALAYYLARDGRESVADEGRRRQAAGGLRGCQRTAQHDNIDRMGFEFNLSADKADVAAELPTTVSRAKVNLGGGEEWANDDDDELVMPAMGEDGASPDLAALQAKCVAALQAHRSGKKLKHAGGESKRGSSSNGAATGAASSASPKPVTSSAALEEDDIFAGAGVYNADDAVNEKQAAPKRSRWDDSAAPAFPAAVSAGGGEGYFANLRATGWVPGDDASSVESAQQAGDLANIGAGIKGLAKAADRMEARKEGRAVAAPAVPSADLSTGYKGTGYGEDHDYNFGGEE